MFDWFLKNTPIFYFVQSLWRDEAFSILIAEKPPSSFISSLNFEPPLYYIFLHIWIRLFGTSEIAVRSLSLVGFSLAICVVIVWAEKRFKHHWLSWMLPLLFFFNPMLLYYAFEARAYGWLMFFATLSVYAYAQKNYFLTSIANIFAFYTHTYAIFIPFVQCIHYILSHSYKRKFLKLKHLLSDKYFRSLFFTGISILPWFYPIYEEVKKMRPMWYYPVDFQLLKSVLGNMFIGYDGTPGGLWRITFVLSFLLCCAFFIAFKNKEHKQEKLYLLFMITIPLILVIGVSFIKPLFVHRYLIYVTIAQVFLVAHAINSIKNRTIQKLLAGIVLLFFVSLNIYFPQRKAKLDIRSVVKEANAMKGQNDFIYVKNPLIFFETIYYSNDRDKVFLYNPDRSPFPWYVGESAFSSSQMAYELPIYPQRAFMIDIDSSVAIHYKTIISSQRIIYE